MELRFSKSSYSDGPYAACVEAASGVPDRYFRDSKNPGGGVLAFSPASCGAFIKALKSE
ncbi:DUF397 domain-containing protein [Actinocorallia sp. API 0066]|uniref:DUF397 domain-containing protein n=1 Tax=Actinocorallia sp. API 0066 TaxID=2896846 RepID=UPI001E4D96B5|nr:DUF397 domain-containing protein [Actinocorallia sp. API 0066]MCD0449318.1 DUF397 domain-containing protein [Actinocorallia sp. API 0066]